MKASSGVLFSCFLLLLSRVAAAQTYSALYDFESHPGAPWASQPSGIIAQGRDGNMYSTSNGGIDAGTVFKFTPAGKVSVLHDFVGTDGSVPSGGLTLGTDGNFYGTTSQTNGGTPAQNAGTVFKISSGGKLTTLHFFDGTDGANPSSPPIQANDGNFYGTTQGTEGYNTGTIYKITSSGVFSLLYTFGSATTIGSPVAPLVLGNDGNLYGTLRSGDNPATGTVFKITTIGELTILHTFAGVSPLGPMTIAVDGNFYGTATAGTLGHAYAVVFKITPGGSYTVVHKFDYQSDPLGGGGVYGGVVQGTDGYLYGGTAIGGTSDEGILFRVSTTGADFSVLQDLDGTDGAVVLTTAIQNTNGIFYGATSQGGTNLGVIYSLNMGVPPFLTLLPHSGKIGKTVQFLGQGFTGATAVSFNGTAAASFTVVSDTYMTAILPAGATTGYVTVTTPGGTLQSNKEFRVTPP